MRFTKLATTAAALLLSGSVFASNMGFKLVYPLKTFAAGVHDGTNYVSYPYFNSFATQDAAGMFADAPAGTVSIGRWNPLTRTVDACTAAACGGFGDVNFPLTKGEAYIVTVNANVNWTIVGSHDNAYAVPMKTFAAGVHDGTNVVSVPYHTNKVDAAGLFGEMPAGTISVGRWNPATRTLDTCTAAACGGFGDVNFPVTIGEAYIIVVNVNNSWTPAHY